MPKLIRLYIVSVAAGFALSGIFVALLLWFDVARLGYLVARSDIGFIAVIMLVIFNGIVFSGVQFSIAVMRLGREGDGSGGGGRRLFTKGYDRGVPVPVTVTAAQRRPRA